MLRNLTLILIVLNKKAMHEVLYTYSFPFVICTLAYREDKYSRSWHRIKSK